MKRLTVDIVEFDVQTEDTLVLCSDGLTSMVPDDEIRQCLLDALPDPNRSCQLLVEAANKAGGKDNITVVVVHIPKRERDA